MERQESQHPVPMSETRPGRRPALMPHNPPRPMQQATKAKRGRGQRHSRAMQKQVQQQQKEEEDSHSSDWLAAEANVRSSTGLLSSMSHQQILSCLLRRKSRRPQKHKSWTHRPQKQPRLKRQFQPTGRRAVARESEAGTWMLLAMHRPGTSRSCSSPLSTACEWLPIDSCSISQVSPQPEARESPPWRVKKSAKKSIRPSAIHACSAGQKQNLLPAPVMHHTSSQVCTLGCTFKCMKLCKVQQLSNCGPGCGGRARGGGEQILR